MTSETKTTIFDTLKIVFLTTVIACVLVVIIYAGREGYEYYESQPVTQAEVEEREERPEYIGGILYERVGNDVIVRWI